MDDLKFEELVKKAMLAFNLPRGKAAEYVAISNGLSDGDVIIVDDEPESDAITTQEEN